ncbi:rhamnan synthesis F family protein [Pseudoclavibacter terrae]|uniref:rhamnan synthesis F family protein n=1 Tax=Pseudoclavibacter terrae TaxID=1530195 RepID=UPI002330D9DB|nr:rhamnan synthesis F family protein [Pseudoclavibacter terrae]
MAVTRREMPAGLDARRADPLFDAEWYGAAYPDVAASSMHGWLHFAVHGDAEGRAPGPGFDPSFYRRTYMPLEGEHPFAYYSTHGRGEGHVPRRLDLSAADSAAKMREVLASVRNPVLLVGNDAQRAGAPLLLLGLASRLRQLGWSPIFLLQRAGPLLRRFASTGPTLIADEGWDLSAMGREIPRWTPIVGNTGWGAQLVAELGVSSSALLLIHEMPAYLIEHSLLGSLESAHTVVASMPSMQAGLAPVLASATHLQTIVPGLRPPEGTRAGSRRVRARLHDEFGESSFVFLSAGYADHRKGFDLFLSAAELIAQREPSAVFVWLGEMSGWASALAANALSAGMRLCLPGFQVSPADWYAAADVYLLASRQDPGPTTVMDAACVGVPFVGLEADIGLRDLGQVVERTGEFVPDVASLARRAVEVAGHETAQSRRARGAFGRGYRSFEVYVDDVIEVLGEVRGATMRLSPVQKAFARAQLATVGGLRSPRLRGLLLRGFALPGLVRRRVRRALRSAPTPRRQRLASVAAVQGEAAEGSEATGSDRDSAQSIRPGDRGWLPATSLLSHAGSDLDLRIVRRAGLSPWPLVRDVEEAGARIQRITQYDATRPPRWVRERSRPPRPRRAIATGLPPRDAVWFAPAEPVGLARPVGVFVHAYYLDIAVVLAQRLAMIEHPMSVYVSTDTDEKAAQLREIFPDAVVRVFANRGTDVYPKIYGFAAEHADHDIVLHLHTKRSAHSSHLSNWLPFLLDCLLPSVGGVNAILGAFASTPGLGMVSPSHFPSLGAATNWGPNRAIAEVLTWGRGWPNLPENGRLIFPAGSMFWARSTALEPLQRLEIPLTAFDVVYRPDGTVAHAVERLLGVSCEAAGLQQLVVGRSEGVGVLRVEDLRRQRAFRART